MAPSRSPRDASEQKVSWGWFPITSSGLGPVMIALGGLGGRDTGEEEQDSSAVQSRLISIDVQRCRAMAARNW